MFRGRHGGDEAGPIRVAHCPIGTGWGRGGGAGTEWQELKGVGRKERSLLRLCGGPGWVSRPSASSICFRPSRVVLMSAELVGGGCLWSACGRLEVQERIELARQMALRPVSSPACTPYAVLLTRRLFRFKSWPSWSECSAWPCLQHRCLSPAKCKSHVGWLCFCVGPCASHNQESHSHHISPSVHLGAVTTREGASLSEEALVLPVLMLPKTDIF